MVNILCLGMLLRWFVNLYDLEVIEEEAFFKWKENISDDYPGKGKALFQVCIQTDNICFLSFFHIFFRMMHCTTVRCAWYLFAG